MKRMNRQNGAVLVVSLILLLLLTMLGINSMESTVLQERMAGNSTDYNRALQAGEVALREGENWIEDLSGRPAASATTPSSSEVWALNAPKDSGETTMWWEHRDESWWASNALQSTASLGNLAVLPYYLHEEFAFVRDSLTVGTPGDVSGRSIIRVTSRGIGGNAKTVVLLQSTYARRF